MGGPPGRGGGGGRWWARTTSGPPIQSAGGEDFSWYGDRARLGYFRLGVWDPAGLQVDLHAGGFDLHERAIGLGAQILAGAALRALADLASA